ncbi:hypothetical protein LZ554_005326 [Drepanopeziza brunnea f. sp. 'monogermtubi']|nr:hypothetical protein LZ554_005326 [Drepanopeziza brunnea f. sp. 'monogermtubi']
MAAPTREEDITPRNPSRRYSKVLMKRFNTKLSWQQTFLSVADTSYRWLPADGFLGLAFSDIAASNTKTLLETFMQNRLLDSPPFGIYYGKELANTGNVTEGVLTLGGSKEEQFVDGKPDVDQAPARIRFLGLVSFGRPRWRQPDADSGQRWPSSLRHGSGGDLSAAGAD